MRIVYRTHLVRCPDCDSKLKAYRTRTRRVISVEYGLFEAVHRIRKCGKCNRLFRSDALDDLIGPYCTYSNDVMVDAAMKRFIDGRSCPEITPFTGISERQARNLSNMALDIMTDIHVERLPELRKAVSSCILQIDGTVDSDFALIVVVRDAKSGFTLYSERCFSESEENMTRVLEKVKKRFGMPSGSISDMRAGILKAIVKVFPGIPVRICLLHFLRDLGKDLMQDLHTDLGIMINRAGIKSEIRAILRDLPEYHTASLLELEDGFCSDREKMEIMGIRRILETFSSHTGSSGYGFPFSLKHFNFYNASVQAMSELNELENAARDQHALSVIAGIKSLLAGITDNMEIRHTASGIGGINALFQGFRKTFHLPEKGDLSTDAGKDDPVHESCGIFIGQLREILRSGAPVHEMEAAKQMISAYEKWEKHLFAQNPEGTIPRTNNSLEQLFRRIRRNVRKRCGNIATGRYLSLNGDRMAIFQNLAIPEYRKAVFGSEDIASVFGRHRKSSRGNGMSRNMIIRLVDRGRSALISGTLRSDPFSEEMMEAAYETRKKEPIAGN